MLLFCCICCPFFSDLDWWRAILFFYVAISPPVRLNIIAPSEEFFFLILAAAAAAATMLIFALNKNIVYFCFSCALILLSAIRPFHSSNCCIFISFKLKKCNFRHLKNLNFIPLLKVSRRKECLTVLAQASETFQTFFLQKIWAF